MLILRKDRLALKGLKTKVTRPSVNITDGWEPCFLCLQHDLFGMFSKGFDTIRAVGSTFRAVNSFIKRKYDIMMIENNNLIK